MKNTAKHWYDYLWIVTPIYLGLGFFNILFAWLGMIFFCLPLLISIFGGGKLYCNRYCDRGQCLGLLGGRLRLSANRPTPRFVPILQKIENPEFRAFLMCETAWWGTDSEVRYLMRYFDDDNFTVRRAAFACMGIRKFAEAEKPMQDGFYKQTENQRRTILRACLAIGSWRNVPFFVEAYNSSTADFTRRTALRCLWASGAQGHAAFHRLLAKANPEDKILFDHVECELINHDAL